MRVTVDGFGIFDISEEKIPQLLDFLSKASAVKVQESNCVRERTDDGFTGRELLGE